MGVLTEAGILGERDPGKILASVWFLVELRTLLRAKVDLGRGTRLCKLQDLV